MDIKGKNILITGGARVGQVVAHSLAKAGANIAMTYFRSESEVKEAIAEISKTHNVEAKAYQVDISEEEQVKELMRSVTKDFKSIDGLINMASIFQEDTQVSFKELHRIFAANAFGNILVSRLFADAAKEEGKRNAPIVSFIDWAVDHPYDEYDMYLASKAALRHYLMGLQVSFTGYIRVVNIHPGMILAPKDFPEDVRQRIIDNTPTKDIGTPEQAAQLVKTALELDYLVDNIYLAGGQQWRHRLQS